jgi:hypothetical protein
MVKSIDYVCADNCKGKFTFNDGSTYVGFFKDGLKHGKGKLTFAEGLVYKGNFENNEFCGNVINQRANWFQGDQQKRRIRKICIYCASSYTYRLPKCERCMRARYCGVTCQHKDWIQHKLECTDCV